MKLKSGDGISKHEALALFFPQSPQANQKIANAIRAAHKERKGKFSWIKWNGKPHAEDLLFEKITKPNEGALLRFMDSEDFKSASVAIQEKIRWIGLRSFLPDAVSWRSEFNYVQAQLKAGKKCDPLLIREVVIQGYELGLNTWIEHPDFKSVAGSLLSDEIHGRGGTSSRNAFIRLALDFHNRRSLGDVPTLALFHRFPNKDQLLEVIFDTESEFKLPTVIAKEVLRRLARVPSDPLYPYKYVQKLSYLHTKIIAAEKSEVGLQPLVERASAFMGVLFDSEIKFSEQDKTTLKSLYGKYLPVDLWPNDFFNSRIDYMRFVQLGVPVQDDHGFWNKIFRQDLWPRNAINVAVHNRSQEFWNEFLKVVSKVKIKENYPIESRVIEQLIPEPSASDSYIQFLQLLKALGRAEPLDTQKSGFSLSFNSPEAHMALIEHYFAMKENKVTPEKVKEFTEQHLERLKPGDIIMLRSELLKLRDLIISVAAVNKSNLLEPLVLAIRKKSIIQSFESADFFVHKPVKDDVISAGYLISMLADLYPNLLKNSFFNLETALKFSDALDERFQFLDHHSYLFKDNEQIQHREKVSKLFKFRIDLAKEGLKARKIPTLSHLMTLLKSLNGPYNQMLHRPMQDFFNDHKDLIAELPLTEGQRKLLPYVFYSPNLDFHNNFHALLKESSSTTTGAQTIQPIIQIDPAQVERHKTQIAEMHHRMQKLEQELDRTKDKLSAAETKVAELNRQPPLQPVPFGHSFQEALPSSEFRTIPGPTLEVSRFLGEGEYSFVHLGRMGRRNGQDLLVAIKIGRSSEEIDTFRTSIDYLERIEAAAKTPEEKSRNVTVEYSNLTRSRPMAVLRLVDGRDLHAIQKKNGVKLSPKVAVHIAAGIARALSVAYRAGIVHRDLKPPNVLIDKTGAVVLADYGGEKTTAGDPSRSRLAHSQLGKSMAVGSPEAISNDLYYPPQNLEVRNKQQTEFYAIGSLFHEMLTGIVIHGKTTLDAVYKPEFEKEFQALPSRAQELLETLMLRTSGYLKTERATSLDRDILPLLVELERVLPGGREALVELVKATPPNELKPSPEAVEVLNALQVEEREKLVDTAAPDVPPTPPTTVITVESKPKSKADATPQATNAAKRAEPPRSSHRIVVDDKAPITKELSVENTIIELPDVGSPGTPAATSTPALRETIENNAQPKQFEP